MPKYFRGRIQQCARAAVVLVAALTLLVVAGYKIGPESVWPLALLQYFPHVLFLLPALVAVALSFTIGRGWQVVSISSVLVFVTFVMGFELNTGDHGTGRVRLMTYNVKAYLAANEPLGMWPIKFEIDLHDADIIVLQDARPLVAMLEEEPHVARLMFGSRHLYTYGQYVVASRYTLQDCGPGSIPFRGYSHTYVRCVVDVTGNKFDLFTAHFLSPREGLSAVRYKRLRGIDQWKQNIADRMVQADGLARDLRANVNPIVVAGDLNAPEQSLVVRTLLDTGLRNAFSDAGRGFGYTYGHELLYGGSFMRIDHVLVSSKIGVANCFAGGAEGSSHRAVVADLILGGRK